MKKSLSVVVAASMVFSMFASVASAADAKVPTTAQEKFEFLKSKGIFEGINDAGDAGLDQAMTRAQVAKILVKLAGLTEDAAAASVYKDIKGSDEAWAEGFIGAATKAGIFDGKAAGVFDPEGTFTAEELAKVLDVAAGLKVEAGTVKGEVSDWAKDYVATAIKAGLIAEAADYTKPALREALVTSSFAAYDKINVVQASVDIKASGAKKFQVTFDKAVDTSKATFAVKKGTIDVNIASVAWDDAKKVATVTTAANFTKGDYVVTVGGVAEFKKTITVEDQKVAEIKFSSDKAAMDRNVNTSVSFGYNVLNQYGEDVTTSNPVTVTIGKANVALPAGATKASATSSTLVASSGNFTLDEKFTVSLLSDNGVFASQVLTVSAPARVATVEVVKLHNDSSYELLTDKTAGDFYLLLKAKDQYGNAVTNATYAGADLVVNVINDSYVNKGAYTNKTVDGTNYLALQLATPTAGALKAGKATFMFVSNTTGNKTSYEVEVKDVAKIDTLSLTAPDIAVAGEKVEIPFSAVDQFGAEVKTASTLSATGAFITPLTATVNGTAVAATNFGFTQDYVANKAKLVLNLGTTTLTDDATVFVSGVTSTGKLVTLSFTVKKNATPAQIVGFTSDLKTAVAIGATSSITTAKVYVLDQYGRKTTLDKFPTYNATFTSGTTANITVSGLSITGVASGTSTITAALTGVTGSEYTFTARAVKLSEITGYEVADIAKLFATDATAYQKSVAVNGLLADGTKVALSVNDPSFYSVYVPAGLGYDTVTGKVYAPAALKGTGAALDVNGTTSEKSYSVVVTGVTNTGPVNIEKTVVASNSNPAIASLALRTLDQVTNDSEGLISVKLDDAKAYGTFEALADDAVKALDQYGVEITGIANKFANSTVKVSNFTSTSRTTLTGATGVNAGDTFNVTVITSNAKTITFKVVINSN